MTEHDVERGLRAMGIDRPSARVVALLPLVEVAWADGTIQEAERSLILAAARERYGLDEAGLGVLDGWLKTPPDPVLVEQGRNLLAALCSKPDAGFDALPCHDVVVLSREVAKAAGGFFGFGAIEHSEARVIDEIARALRISADRPWILPDEPTWVPDDADAENEGPAVQVTFHRVVTGPVGASVVHYDPDRGDQVCALGDVPVGIGRADDNAIQIEYDAHVSRHHAEVRRADRGFVIRDLGSVSGTWVDGRRIEEHLLVDGETVHVGSTTLFFQGA